MSAVPREAEMDSAVGAARVAIDSAAGRGDVAALARFLTPDGVVVVEKDTLHGFAEVASYYRASRPRAVGGRFEFRPNRTDLCLDGALELGGSLFLVTRNSDGTADTLQPDYAVRWVRDPAGAWRVRSLKLQRQAARSAAFAEGCGTYLAQAAFARRRVLLTIEMPFGVASGKARDEMRGIMTGRGYVVPGPVQGGDDQIGLLDLNPRAMETASLRLGVRVRVLGPFTAELVGTLLPSQVTMTGANATGHSYVVFKSRQSSLGALAGAEWRRFRAAAGPVLIRTSGSLVERDFRSIQGGWFGFVHVDEPWSSSATGWMALGAYTWSFSSSLFAELRATWLGATSEFRSPSTVFPSARSDVSGYQLTLVVGIAR
jgi:ketosteroid isomerase-like protein